MRTLTKVLTVVAIFLAVFVLLLETVPRFAAIPGLTLRDLDPHRVGMAEARIEPHPYLAYVPKRNYVEVNPEHRFEHNSLGFRGPEITVEKPAGTLRILCLGGSSTYGHGPSSNETTWPARLEHHLEEARPGLALEVVNGGCQGYSTFESLANLSFRGRPLEPDVVIVYHTINDMRCALYPGVVPDNTHWRANWMRSEVTPFEHSWTYLTLRAKFTDYVAQQGDIGSLLIVDFDRNMCSDTDAYAWTSDVGMDNFVRNLHSIRAITLDMGAELVVATQGIKRSTLDKARSREDQLRAFDHMTELLKQFAQDTGTTLVDAAPVLAAEELRRRRQKVEPKVFTNDVHMTDVGADLLARTFADAILAGGHLERAAQRTPNR